MKFQLKAFGFLMIALPTIASATWQIADPSRGVPSAQGKHYSGYPGRYSGKVQADIFKGSLQGNVERIAMQHGWEVKWAVKQKMSVLLEAHLAEPDFQTLMNELLSHYPVVADYQYNFKHGQKRLSVTLADRR